MTVQLPSERKWSPDIIEWVVEHHRAQDKLTGAVDPEAAAEVLSSVSRNVPA